MKVYDMQQYMERQKAKRFVITRCDCYHSIPVKDMGSYKYKLYLRRNGRFYFKNSLRKLSMEELEYSYFHVGNSYYIFFYTP